jgi:hypothetical protein
MLCRRRLARSGLGVPHLANSTLFLRDAPRGETSGELSVLLDPWTRDNPDMDNFNDSKSVSFMDFMRLERSDEVLELRRGDPRLGDPVPVEVTVSIEVKESWGLVVTVNGRKSSSKDSFEMEGFVGDRLGDRLMVPLKIPVINCSLDLVWRRDFFRRNDRKWCRLLLSRLDGDIVGDIATVLFMVFLLL